MAGETEGRKTRPVCIAVTVAKSDGETVVFTLPITPQPPSASRKFIEVPQIESQRVGLETRVRKWVMQDEINKPARLKTVRKPPTFLTKERSWSAWLRAL